MEKAILTTAVGRGEPGVAGPEAQRAAREAVLGVPLFPNLERMLIAAFGPTAEAIMLHQLCYWYGREKYRDGRKLYITLEGWREQRGLNRKQVDKGRARLRPTGILEETYGTYKRIHYALDWVRLARRIAIDIPEGGSVGTATPQGGTVETGAPEGDAVWSAIPPRATPGVDGPLGNGNYGTPEGAGGGAQSNAREYAGEYLKELPRNHGRADAATPPAPAGSSPTLEAEAQEKIDECLRSRPEEMLVEIAKFWGRAAAREGKASLTARRRWQEFVEPLSAALAFCDERTVLYALEQANEYGARDMAYFATVLRNNPRGYGGSGSYVSPNVWPKKGDAAERSDDWFYN